MRDYEKQATLDRHNQIINELAEIKEQIAEIHRLMIDKSDWENQQRILQTDREHHFLDR